MTLASMMTETVEVLRRTVTGEDESGNEISSFTLLATVDAFVSRAMTGTRGLSTGESIVGHDQVTADYAFILPATVDIQPYDRLVHLGRTFEVEGLPAPAIKPGAGVQFMVCRGKWVEG